MTWMDAVNLCLTAIGEAPVNSLSSPGVDASQAVNILNEVNRAVQSEGWHFNTRRGVVLPRQAFTPFFIYVPTTTLFVDTIEEDKGIDVVVVDDKLYNLREDTFEFDKDLKCNMTVLLNFEHMPAQAQQYVAVRAARVFQARTIGSGELNNLTSEDEVKARVALKKIESRRADRNVMTDNNFALRTKLRSWNRRGF
jgi:hypothetical protein